MIYAENNILIENQKKQEHDERKEQLLPSRLMKEKRPNKEAAAKVSRPKVQSRVIYREVVEIGKYVNIVKGWN